MYLLLPPASTHVPSALYLTDVKALVPATLAAVLRSDILRPPETSRRASTPFSCAASETFQNVSCPSSVVTAICFESGRKATDRISAMSCSGSLVCVRAKMFQTRTVLSQLPLTSVPASGENDKDDTGPSWPDSLSSSWPVWTDQM